MANMLANAAEYTNPGGTIAVSAHADGEVAAVSVRDNGIGIAPTLMPRVFEIFEQGACSLDRAPAGLGLGLAIVKSIVGLHGGTVTAESAAADMLDLWLRTLGHVTRTARDGRSALETLAAFVPDVALLDIGLPGMDGYELARRIRSTAGDKPPILIAISGYGQESDRERSRAAGFSHHLVKPVDAPQLQEILGTANHLVPDDELGRIMRAQGA